MSSSYRPDETDAQLFAEKTWLQGALLSNVVYGVELTLFAICFKHLLARQSMCGTYRRYILLAFIVVLFILGTIFVYSLAEFTQLAFIEDRDFPGGPSAFEKDMFWIPVDELGVVVFVMGNWLMDLLLVWRCMVIFTGVRRIPLWAIMVVPCGLLLASVGLGILFLIKTSASSPFGAVGFSLAYFSTTLGLNIIVTCLIVARLLFYRWQFARVLGAEHVTHYSNLAAILVESASLYSIFSLLFLVPLALNYPLASVFLQSMGQVQTVSSLLIIFRVATGKGWTDTPTPIATNPDAIRFKHISSIQFSTPSKPGSPEVGVTLAREVLSDLAESAV